MEELVLRSEQAKDEVLFSFGQRLHINELLTSSAYNKLFTQMGFTVLKTHNLDTDLTVTSEMTLAHIQTHREEVRKKIDQAFWPALDRDFDRPQALQLIYDQKLGCMVLVLQKPLN